MTQSVSEKVASIHLSTMMRLDTYPSDQEKTMLMFVVKIRHLLETEDNREILLAVCKNAKIDFHVPLFDTMVQIYFQMLSDNGTITKEHILAHCPPRFTHKI
jgi:hypothetical protein